MTNPLYKWQPKPVTRAQLQAFLRQNLETIRQEKDRGEVGPATTRFRELAQQVVEPTNIRGEE